MKTRKDGVFCSGGVVWKTRDRNGRGKRAPDHHGGRRRCLQRTRTSCRLVLLSRREAQLPLSQPLCYQKIHFSSSQSISTNISCSQSSTGAMPITSTSSPTFSGEVDLLAAHRARKGKSSLRSR